MSRLPTYSANRAAVNAFNAAMKKKIVAARETADALAKLRAGKSPRSAHVMSKAKGEWEDGHFFRSAKELRRYRDLKLMQTAKLIVELKPQPSWSIDVNGLHIQDVRADFSYYDRTTGRLVVEDVKEERIGRDGKVKFTTHTDQSKIGYKLLLAVHGIDVVIVK